MHLPSKKMNQAKLGIPLTFVEFRDFRGLNFSFQVASFPRSPPESGMRQGKDGIPPGSASSSSLVAHLSD
jgi:hypothetical protein